jgi:PelA/Pel-15E family pectate lyase
VEAVDRGIGCICAVQVVVSGRPTIWGQQHDPLTLQPVSARTYEHVALASRESAAVTELLLSLPSPSPLVQRAVRGAAIWFQDNALYGFEYGQKQQRTRRPGAGPLWARFAEIGTNRPIFSNRDGVVLYEFDQLDEERRTGYSWYSAEPARTLALYRSWSGRHRRRRRSDTWRLEGAGHCRGGSALR